MHFSRIITFMVAWIPTKKIKQIIEGLIPNNNFATNYTIITYGNEILAVATPSVQGSPDNYVSRRVGTSSLFYSRHCETIALANSRVRKIIQKRRKVNNIELINFRINKEGKFLNGCCCLACCRTLERFGINKIVYTDNDGNFIKTTIQNVKQNAQMSRGSRLYT